MKGNSVVVAVVAAAVIAVPATAATFEPETGTGTLSKGQIQSAFGWNDRTFQQQAESLTFEAEKVWAYSWACSATETASARITSWFPLLTPESFFSTDPNEPLAHTYSPVKNPRGKVLRYTFTGYGPGVPTANPPFFIGWCWSPPREVEPVAEVRTVEIYATAATGERRMVTSVPAP